MIFKMKKRRDPFVFLLFFMLFVFLVFILFIGGEAFISRLDTNYCRDECEKHSQFYKTSNENFCECIDPYGDLKYYPNERKDVT